MTLNEYQEKAMGTCLPSSENFSYMMLNLVGEVGEFASKVAKSIRKEQATIGGFVDDALPPYNHLSFRDMESWDSWMIELHKEAGDILWQLSGLCTVMGWSLDGVAQANLDKLAARKAVGTIDGNGDGIVRDK